MDKEIITSKQLVWIPKIDDNLFSNIDKLMRDSINKDPLSFYNPSCPGYPNWKVINKFNKSVFLAINISDTNQINIYLSTLYKNYCIEISENYFTPFQHYSRVVARVKQYDNYIEWTESQQLINYESEINESIKRVTNSLIKLGLAKYG